MARQPSISPESRRIIQNERRNIQRQAASAAEERLDAAREEMRNAASRESARVKANNENALIHGIKSIVSTVSSSYGVLPPIDISTNYAQRDLVAWTDFSKVVIKYPSRLVPGDSVGSWKPETLRSFYADVKGISYHEIGHILHTIPFPRLVQLAGEDGWVEPTTLNPVNQPVPVYGSLQNLHPTWNLLEDQRMESAMVSGSPIMADYFTTMVLTHIAHERAVHSPSTWLLLVGRRYLPRKVRLWFQEQFAIAHGIDAVHTVKDIVARYKQGTTPVELVTAVIDLYLFMQSLSVSAPGGVDGHASNGSRPQTNEQIRQTLREAAESPGDNDDTKTQRPSTSAEKPETEQVKDDSKGQGAQDQQDGETGDDESTDGTGSQDDESTDERPTVGQSESDGSDGEGDSGDEASSGQSTDESPSTSQPTPGEGAGTGRPNDEFDPSQTSPSDFLENVQDLIDQAREAQQQDSSLDEAVRATYETANSSDLVMARTQRIHTEYGDEFLSTAETVARGLEDALRVFTAENTPIWQNRQSRGVIDPFAYRTRQSGSTDYRRLYQEGDIGTDISVVVMLDTSGSMSGSDEALGLAAYATKRACDSVDVPCTVMTFDYDTRIVWTSTESPEPICLSADGGTNPSSGLSVLDEFVFDKSDQLVVVMTDGQFGNGVTLKKYHAPGRHFLGLGYGPMVSTHYLRAVGFHESYIVDNLLSVPQIVANFLAAYIRG